MRDFFRFLSRHGLVLAIALVVLVAILVLMGRSPAPEQPQPGAEDRPLVVVGTFSLIGDWLQAVGGEHIDLRVLTPVGAEVHEWELQPRNFIDLESADLVFYNGMMLEQWMRQVAVAVGEDVPLIGLAERSDYPVQHIITGDYSGEPDPHMWMDPRAVVEYVGVIAQTLARHDPANAAGYEARAQAYVDQLETLHREVADKFAAIPESSRVLITSEAAFPYFAEAYGFFHDGIWGNNAEVEGSPRQIMRITGVIEQRRPAAVFWESTISDRYVTSLARDTGVEVAGPLYVDSLGPAGSGAETYLKMMRHNARLIAEALEEVS